MLSVHTFLLVLVVTAAPQDQRTRVVAMISAWAVRRHRRGGACGAHGRQPGLATAGHSGGWRGW